MNLKRVVQLVFAASSFLAVQAVQAAPISCPDSFTTNPTAKVEDSTGLLTASDECEYLSDPDQNNVASVDNINAAEFFGFSDWTANTGNLQVDVNSSTGTWEIADVDFDAFDYMIVFKSGAGTNLVAFMLNELFDEGVWSTPFTSPPFTFNGDATSRDVSHYTIVERPDGGGPGNEIPEPGMLALLGVGLLGYSAARRRGLKK